MEKKWWTHKYKMNVSLSRCLIPARYGERWYKQGYESDFSDTAEVEIEIEIRRQKKHWHWYNNASHDGFELRTPWFVLGTYVWFRTPEEHLRRLD